MKNLKKGAKVTSFSEGFSCYISTPKQEKDCLTTQDFQALVNFVINGFS